MRRSLRLQPQRVVHLVRRRRPRLIHARPRTLGPVEHRLRSRSSSRLGPLPQRSPRKRPLPLGPAVEPLLQCRAGRARVPGQRKEWSERQVWTDGTREAAQQAADSVTFATVALKALRQSHLQSWIKAMSQPAPTRSAGLAASTIRTRYNYVHMALRAAVLDRRIPSNPAEGIRLPRKRPAEAAMTIPSVEEVRRAYDAAAPEFRAFVGLAAFAGLRLGEAAGVQVGDIDFLRRTLDVRRQVQGATRKTATITRPKYGSERTVPIPTHLVNLLAQHVETHRHPGRGQMAVLPGQ